MGHSPPAQRIVIINDFSTARGGATTLAIDLAVRLRRKGCEVTYFTGDDGESDELAGAGVRIVALHGKKLLSDGAGALWRGVYNQQARQRLDLLISEEASQNAVFHVHGWAQILSPSIFASLEPVASRTVVTCHDFFLACPNGNYTIYPKGKVCTFTPLSVECLACDCDKRNYAQKVWRVTRHAALRQTIETVKKKCRFLTIHAGMIPWLEKGGLPADRMSALPNPVDAAADLRTPAETNREILYVGRLEHEKGADLAAAAARKAGVPFRVVGEGATKEEIRRANPETMFEGWRRREEIPAFFSRARLVVAPSRCIEPFGLAAVEALASGVPVIASNTLLIARDIEAGGMGHAIDPTDTGAFAALLSRLSRDDDSVRKMSERGFEMANTIAVTSSQWVDAHLDIYRALASAAPSSEFKNPPGRDAPAQEVGHAQPVAPNAP